MSKVNKWDNSGRNYNTQYTNDYDPYMKDSYRSKNSSGGEAASMFYSMSEKGHKRYNNLNSHNNIHHKSGGGGRTNYNSSEWRNEGEEQFFKNTRKNKRVDYYAVSINESLSASSNPNVENNSFTYNNSAQSANNVNNGNNSSKFSSTKNSNNYWNNFSNPNSGNSSNNYSNNNTVHFKNPSDKFFDKNEKGEKMEKQEKRNEIKQDEGYNGNINGNKNGYTKQSNHNGYNQNVQVNINNSVFNFYQHPNGRYQNFGENYAPNPNWELKRTFIQSPDQINSNANSSYNYPVNSTYNLPFADPSGRTYFNNLMNGNLCPNCSNKNCNNACLNTLHTPSLLYNFNAPSSMNTANNLNSVNNNNPTNFSHMNKKTKPKNHYSNDKIETFNKTHSSFITEPTHESFLIVCVKLKDDNEYIYLKKGDDLFKKASEFCLKNNLNDNLIKPIYETILQAYESIDKIFYQDISTSEINLLKENYETMKKEVEVESKQNLSCITCIGADFQEDENSECMKEIFNLSF